jgi:hypothetical protein
LKEEHHSGQDEHEAGGPRDGAKDEHS